MEMSLFSIDSGKLIQNQSIEAKAGSNTTPLTLNSEPQKGLYILLISYNKEFLTSKLMVQ